MMTAPSPHLNKCLLIANEILYHDDRFLANAKNMKFEYEFENIVWKMEQVSQGPMC